MLMTLCVIGAFWLFAAVAWFRTGRGMLNVLNISMSLGPLFLTLIWRSTARPNAASGLLQVRMNEFGCLECDLPEETVGAPDIQRLWRWIGPAIWIALAAIAIATGELPWIFGAALTLVVLGILAPLNAARKRELIRAESDPLGKRLILCAQERGIHVAPIRWNRVESLNVSEPLPGRLGRRRIVVRDRGFLSTSLIDAEVDCTERQAAELWNRAMGWITAQRIHLPSECSRRRSAGRRLRSGRD
ncbi:MAG TPA: hypothetical protein VLJ39_21510 [Tepidisphaeraceae bacterium]|nr:hypothetical protein [Tepidisphaeraceae bacterium]